MLTCYKKQAELFERFIGGGWKCRYDNYVYKMLNIGNPTSCNHNEILETSNVNIYTYVYGFSVSQKEARNCPLGTRLKVKYGGGKTEKIYDAKVNQFSYNCKKEISFV